MKYLLISASPVLTKIALVEDSRLIDIDMDTASAPSLVGNIYLGRLENINSKKFAFINIGQEKPGFLQLDDKKQSGIENLRLSQGKDIMVQVLKDTHENKGVYLSTELTFPGRYCVLTKRLDGRLDINISSKITGDELRERLKSVASSCCPEGYGLILRTESLSASIDDLSAEISKLHTKAENALSTGTYAKAPALLNPTGNVVKCLTSFMVHKPDRIICDSEDIAEEIGPAILDYGYQNIEIYDGTIGLFNAHGIEKQIQELGHEKIWLKSGGFLLIEENKTAIFIDVNSGKSINNKSVLKLNIEACEEAVRQIRLRNLSGVIIVDFISMAGENDRGALLNLTETLVKSDRLKTTVAEFSRLGHMYITRRKEKPSFKERFTVECLNCMGTGFIPHMTVIADRIYWEARRILQQTIYNRLEISLNNAVKKEIEKNNYLTGLESEFKAEITLSPIETGKIDYYNISAQKL
ncbi:MAG: ribonuclease E/G [Clostridiales bacterium]|jgi:ribonuclease G|nr:ribonuclease E/G [Clostridiales bacterium]